MMKKNDTKVVGVKFSHKTDDKIGKTYYYRTTKDLKKGDMIRVKVKTGGNPEVLITDVKDDDGGNYKKL